MKLKKGFVTYESSDGQILTAAQGFRGMARSNATAAFIIDCLKQETTEGAIVDRMVQKYDAPRAVIEGDVKRQIELLRGIGALDE